MLSKNVFATEKNKMTLKQIMKSFLLLIIFCSCESRTDQKEVVESKTNVDTTKNNYISTILNNGGILFKKNCAVCHCAPISNCESSSNVKLKNIFDTLPVNSLDRIIRFVQDSKELKQNARVPKAAYEHKFIEKLDENEIKVIVQYLWLESR